MRRVTVTLPDEIVDEIDRREVNRSRFVTEAARRELEWRRYQELQRSISNPHPECGRVAEMGVEDWGRGSGSDDEGLVDLEAGRVVRWEPGMGWTGPSE
ncbi:MAG: ribbon-helix-helix domain-containing protein [Thermoanaerobaculales bacterium]|nr:ribbon-helix-helix domain-containing protein [Thermoanaerobaculales bacterium]